MCIVFFGWSKTNNKEEYVAFIDQFIHAFLAEKKKEKPELHELVQLYQLHRHSKTCRKYKNEACRFKFGNFFSKETLVAETLPESMPEEIKLLVLSKRKEILLKNYTNYINYTDYRNTSQRLYRRFS